MAHPTYRKSSPSADVLELEENDVADQNEQKLRSLCDAIEEKFGVKLLTSKEANFPKLLENVRRLKTQTESQPKPDSP